MTLFRLPTRVLVVAACSCALPCSIWAEQPALPRENHPWGSFPVGAWKLVRTTSETLDGKGKVTNVSVTETRTSLVAADSTSYTLRSEIVLDIAGRRIATTPQTVKRGYSGEPPGAVVSIKRLGDAPLAVDGQSVPCEIKQVAFEDGGAKLVSKLHYSPDLAPFVLRRETSIEGGGEEKRNSSLVEVVALDLPQRIQGELKQASFVKTTQKLAQGTKITLEVHCEEVPGSVAAHWASETDASGQVVRRSTLELVGYGLPIASSEPKIVMPRRPHRANKAARRMDQR